MNKYEQFKEWAMNNSTLSLLSEISQDIEFHAEGDVLTHTELTLANLQLKDSREDYLLYIATLFHDIGKLITTIEVDGRVKSPKHAKVGAEYIKILLWSEFTPLERYTITELIRWHGAPIYIYDNIVKSAILSQTVDLNQLYRLSTADMKGRICNTIQDSLDKLLYWNETIKELGQLPYKFINSNFHKKIYKHEENSLLESYYEPKYKGNVIFLSGLPGSGKDYYYNKYLNSLPLLSLDNLRKSLKVKRGDTKAEGQMYQEAQELFKSYLRKGESFVFNSTFLTKSIRQKWIKIAENYTFKTECIYIEPDCKTLKSQNSNREDVVPWKNVENLYSKLEVPHPLEFDKVSYFLNTEICNYPYKL